MLPELQNKSVSLTLPPATQLETNRWYVMYNMGRKGFLYDAESKLYIATAPPTHNGMKYLVRLIEEDGKTYLQTGLGRYFKYLSTSNNGGTTTSATSSNVFTYGSIEEGYFWLKDKNCMVLDANALGSAIDANATVAGWGKDTPTSSTGNNSWRFFPVEIIDTPDDFAQLPHSFGNFSFQSVLNGQFVHLDANNLGFIPEEEDSGSSADGEDEGDVAPDYPTAPVIFTGAGTWTIGMPEGSGQKTHFHIGTDGKFSAGPVSPLRIYRADESAESGFTYRLVSAITEGGAYLIVGEYEGADYAMGSTVSKPGTADQRMLSGKVTFSPTDADPNQLIATFANTATAASGSEAGFHWRFHFGESLIQEPFVYVAGETGGASGSGEPLLTIACVSDIHTQEGWLSGTDWVDKDNAIRKACDVKNVRVRESLDEAIKALKKEKVDVIIVGGDCQSDATVDEEHWRQVRRLMADNLRGVKTDKSDIPVLYVNGNHEYEVASTWGGNGKGYYNWRYTRPFNAGEYYEFPMMSDVGVLAADYDCFYEQAPNDAINATKKTMPVLAAYHYSIKGFDFVVLNCGKHLFRNANNYSYSDESVEWIERKLAHIYADDPSHTKTVFFALHIPFGDSNSINTSEDKGMSYFESTHRLKQVLAQYPGLVMLYGHDHGQDLAYIRQKTSQRITRYDTQGNVIATADGITAYDKDLASGGAQKPRTYSAQSVIFHPYSTKTTTSLGVKGTFAASSANISRILALLDTPTPCTIFPEGNNAISLRLGDGSQHLVFNNGFGLSAGEHQAIRLLHVISDGTNFTVEPVQKAEEGELYLITSVPTAEGGPCNLYKVGSTRSFNVADSYPVTTFNTYFWRAELPAEAQPSFLSSFMGSMRYYNNSNGEPANSAQAARKLIQGLIIYVYPDRIVFDMKNFRNNAQGRVRNDLAPFVVERTMPTTALEQQVSHNPSRAFYRRVDDLSQLVDGSVCLLVDETRRRALGNINNATSKLQAVSVEPTDGILPFSRNASECEFVFEKKPAGATRLAADDPNHWYLRTHDGHIKTADSKIIHRQQAVSAFTGNLLDNEAMNATIVPWTVTLDEQGIANIEHAELGLLRKYSEGMTTGNFAIYQKVVAPQFPAPDTADGASLTAYYCEYPLLMPEGIEAFTIEGLTAEGNLRPVRQPHRIPAKTGLVLRASASALAAGTEGGAILPVIDERYAAPLANSLCGTLADLPTTPPMPAKQGDAATDYVIYRFDGTDFVETGVHTNPCGTAYLVLPQHSAYNPTTAAPLRTLLDNAEVNGVQNVILTPATNSPIYDLSGHRVALPSRPGIYIQNGKKLIIR